MPKGVYRKPHDIIGKTFGELTALSISHRKDKRGRNYRMLLCQCSCGKQKEVRADNVMRVIDPIVSCGHRRDARMKYFGLQALQYSVFRSSHYHDGDITLEDFVRLSQQDCYWCGRSVSESGCLAVSRNKKHQWHYQGLDRINNTIREHTLDNVQPCCFDCNSWKQNKTVQEFEDRIERIYLNFQNENNETI